MTNHRVAQGECVGFIAARHGVTWQAIRGTGPLGEVPGPPNIGLTEDIGALEHSACFTPEGSQRCVRRVTALRLLP